MPRVPRLLQRSCRRWVQRLGIATSRELELALLAMTGFPRWRVGEVLAAGLQAWVASQVVTAPVIAPTIASAAATGSAAAVIGRPTTM